MDWILGRGYWHRELAKWGRQLVWRQWILGGGGETMGEHESWEEVSGEGMGS